MSNEAIFEYINSIRDEYRKASRREKSAILSHARFATNLSRKRLIRLLGSRANGPNGAASRRGRKPRYDRPECLEHLKRIWLALEQPCGKRLKALLPRVIAAYRKRTPTLDDRTEADLRKMSAATIDRLIKQIRVTRGLATTKAPTSQWYRSAVPVQAKDWNITQPGYAQADTVSHCGEHGSGAFASTLTVTDIDSHWTEMRAVFTKRHQGIIRALRDIEQKLPFTLTTIKFDSGSEFMNYEVVSYCRNSFDYRAKPLEVLRSRPYRKNDNCYVEQKNLTHVRQFIGYDRIESSIATRLLDEIYRDLWCPFLNFFMPTFKLIRKERIGSRIKKTYEKPRTPYERLLDSPALTAAAKQKLQETYESLDPFELKLRIEERLKLLFQAIRDEEKPDELLKQCA